jgi:hypothetical protein
MNVNLRDISIKLLLLLLLLMWISVFDLRMSVKKGEQSFLLVFIVSPVMFENVK